MSKADKKGRHHLHIELTPAQYQLLTEQADACGLSKRAYLVRLMERMPLPVKPSQELKDLRWEVHKSIKSPGASMLGSPGPRMPGGGCSCWIRSMN